MFMLSFMLNWFLRINRIFLEDFAVFSLWSLVVGSMCKFVEIDCLFNSLVNKILWEGEENMVLWQLKYDITSALHLVVEWCMALVNLLIKFSEMHINKTVIVLDYGYCLYSQSWTGKI